jgi:hypothetical protein
MTRLILSSAHPDAPQMAELAQVPLALLRPLALRPVLQMVHVEVVVATEKRRLVNCLG